MSEKLKPCPFCGGNASRQDLTDEDNAGGSCIVCDLCGASSPVHFDRKENLYDSWNRRASPTPEGGEEVIEEVIEAAKRIVAWDDDGRLADDEWLVERNDAAIIALARALLSSPRVDEVRREALEEAAKVADEMAGNLKHLGSTIHPLVQIGSHLETCATIARAIRALSLQVG